MRLTELARAILNGGKRPMRCDACGNGFTCSFLGGCWCGEKNLTADARAELKEKYRDCLCPDCLGKHEQPAS
jgi:hypothetical protein